MPITELERQQVIEEHEEKKKQERSEEMARRGRLRMAGMTPDERRKFARKGLRARLRKQKQKRVEK